MLDMFDVVLNMFQQGAGVQGQLSIRSACHSRLRRHLPTKSDKMIAGKDCASSHEGHAMACMYTNEAQTTKCQVVESQKQFPGSLTPTMFTPGDRALALWAELPGYSGTSVRPQIKL